MLTRVVGRMRVRSVLGCLGLLPMLVVVLVCAQQLRATSQGSDRLDRLERSTDAMAAHVELSASIQRELAGVGAASRAEEFGIDPEIISEVGGLDLSGVYVRETDQILDDIGDPELTTAVQESRGGRSSADHVTALGATHDDLVVPRIARLERLTQLHSRDLANREELFDASRRLTITNSLRANYSKLVNLYFLLLPIDSPNPAASRSEMAVLLSRYDADRRALRFHERLQPEPTLEAIAMDHGTLFLLDAARQSIESENFGNEAVDLTDGSAAIQLAGQYRSAAIGTELHLDAARDASLDLKSLVVDARQRTTDRGRRVMALAAVVLTAILLSILAATRVIVTPIRALGRMADALRVGGNIDRLRLDGPIEIRQATDALNQASGNLQRAERQALALADGRLNDASFSEPQAEGSLGRSLDSAVSHLRSTLAEREEYRRRLALEASHDGLTALPNRRTAIRQLNSAISRAERQDATLGVFYVDIDSFKTTNDTLGHVAGDELLRHIANSLTRESREGDIVGRIGGDEFLVVAEPIDGPGGAVRRAERLREAVNSPIDIGGVELVPSISIGVAIAQPGEDAGLVIRNADNALYQAKAGGRNQTVLFDEAMKIKAEHDALLDLAIRDGLTNNEFYLEVQAIVDADGGVPKKHEALVRWRRDGVKVPPLEFIPFAERSDLILDIDRWVIDAALRALANPALADDIANLSVNVSGRHLLRGDLVGEVRRGLAQHNVAADRLTIEITETALLTDLSLVGLQLQGLRSLGAKVAIDDFGTGYTSLGHLRDMPADFLKIDRSFITDLWDERNLSLVRLIIETGHVLGMEIVVEGIETEEQVQTLGELGADYLQGFHFSHPSELMAKPLVETT